MGEVYPDNYVAESSKEQHEDLIQKIHEFFKCLESCKTIESFNKALIDLDLFQAEFKNILGIPGRSHEQQSQEVLRQKAYWELSNIRHLLLMKKEVLEKGLTKFASFSVGGSIGSGYLGYLIGSDSVQKSPEIIFGASAGSLFPAIFLLWKKAILANPQETKSGLSGLISYLPQDLGAKTMWNNGEELIDAFMHSGQQLIEIINRGQNTEKKMQNIQQISLEDISPTFGVIASRKIADGEFQEVIFSGKDNLMNSIIASSNPEIKVLGLNFSVLTRSKNKFLGNVWHDGDHTNRNPFKYGDILNIEKQVQIFTFPEMFERSEKFVNRVKKGGGTEDEILSALYNTGEFQIPYDAGVDSIAFSYGSRGYKILDQNNGWNIQMMESRARLSLLKFITQWTSDESWRTREDKGNEGGRILKELGFSAEEIGNYRKLVGQTNQSKKIEGIPDNNKGLGMDGSCQIVP